MPPAWFITRFVGWRPKLPGLDAGQGGLIDHRGRQTISPGGFSLNLRFSYVLHCQIREVCVLVCQTRLPTHVQT